VQTFVSTKQQSLILTAKSARSRISSSAGVSHVVVHNPHRVVLTSISSSPVVLNPGAAPARPILLILACFLYPSQCLLPWAFKGFMGLFLRGGCSGQCQPWGALNGCWTDCGGLARSAVSCFSCLAACWSLVFCARQSDECCGASVWPAPPPVCHAFQGFLRSRASHAGI